MTAAWLKHYPEGVPPSIDADAYASLVELIEESFTKYAERPACHFMGRRFSFRELDEQSRALAAQLQAMGLGSGDRVAVMMPNVPQYPVAVAAILRAGCVLVNVNPLYTPRELRHQLQDSGASAIVILENFAATLQAAGSAIPPERVVLATLGDMLGVVKGPVVNAVVRHLKKLVPAFDARGMLSFPQAVKRGASLPYRRPDVSAQDVALLQYTGGTTGVSKGAVLSHRNIIANVLQCEAWYRPVLGGLPTGEPLLTVCALPLYHIFAFTVNMMLSLRVGGANILIPNPRDLPAVFKALAPHRFHSFPAVNTLFGALARHPGFATVDWSSLRLSVGGGMAVTAGVAQLWLEKTGCSICEGYGLSETSPTASCNPVNSTQYTGTIGLPLPSTEFKLLDDAGQEVPLGVPGEIAIRGPQVMQGYWQRPDETAAVMTPDGFLRTGDIGVCDERGYFKIVDRKKDMILVSGFNVYPNEIEDVMSRMPGVLECAAVGVPDEKSGEAVRLVIVRQDPTLTEDQVRAYCQAHLTGYKRPRQIEFRADLPKTPVGKILRRELR